MKLESQWNGWFLYLLSKQFFHDSSVIVLFLFRGYKLSPHQMAQLMKIKLPYLYSTLEVFVKWIQYGMYDFHELPLDMKKHMKPEDEELISTVSGRYDGEEHGVVLCFVRKLARLPA